VRLFNFIYLQRLSIIHREKIGRIILNKNDNKLFASI
jgi:hypothetical protein